MEKKLMCLLAECVEKEVSEINEEMEPVEDLEMDSVRILDFVLLIEDNFRIDFRNFSEMSQHMVSVKEMIQFLCGVIERGN